MLAIALATLACGGEQAPPPPATTAPAATAPTMAPAATVAAGDFGVPACDSYMKKYMACVDSKVPEQARAMMRQSLEQTKMQWKQAATTPQGRDGLTMACTQAEATSRGGVPGSMDNSAVPPASGSGRCSHHAAKPAAPSPSVSTSAVRRSKNLIGAIPWA